MADEKQNESADEASAPEKPAGPPVALIGAFIALVIVAETVIYFVMVPTADDVARLAEQQLIEKVEAELTGAPEESEGDQEGTEEFDMGQYEFTFTPPGETSEFTVAFSLVVEINKEDKKRMDELFAAKQARLEHNIQMEVRSASLEELKENQLGLILRRILATSMETLEAEEEDEVPQIRKVLFRSPGFQIYEN